MTNVNVRERFIEDLKLRNLAPLTQKIYLERVDSFFEYHNKNLILLEPNDIRGYLVYLQKEKKLAPNTINQYAAALTFFVNKTYMNIIIFFFRIIIIITAINNQRNNKSKTKNCYI